METETIMALIALAAVIVGPATQLQIAKRQIRAQLVSANRQKWIEEFRSHIAEYSSETIACVTQSPDGTFDVDRFLALTRLSNLIKLFLNLNEESHAKLITVVNQFDRCQRKLNTQKAEEGSFGKEQLAEFADKASSVFNMAHELLLSEGERVKRGE